MNRSRRLRRCLAAVVRGGRPADLRRFSDPAGPAGEDGFILLESIITITLITIIMTALASFYLNTISTTAHQRLRQAAAQVATTNVTSIRSLPSSDLVTGRGASSVSTQFSTATASVLPWLATMTQASDSTAAPTAGATANVPTTPVSTILNNTVFSSTQYLGWCWQPSGTTDCTNTATAQSAGDKFKYLRAVVAVTWNDSSCRGSVCSYVTATLISPDTDPVFNINQTLPPAPIIANPGNQTAYAVNDAVDLQLGVTDGTGVPQFTWSIVAGSLPAGLGMNTTGEITGTPTAQVSGRSVTVMVTDAFLRTDTQTFTWTVLPPLAVTSPGPQASVTGTAITALSLTATGGSGAPYTWVDSGSSLPPGLSLSTVSNKGTVTGTPTTPGNYNVLLTVTDSSGSRTLNVAFTWTITYPPLAASNPGPQVATVNTAIGSLQLSASGGSGNYTWAVNSGLPAGLSMTSAGLITGTPTAISSQTTSITATDTVAGYMQTFSFSFGVVAKPTVSMSPSSTSVGSSVSQAVTYTCPNGPCTFTMSGAPSGLGITASGTNAGLITGTVGGSAMTYTGITVTIKDADGATVISSTFSWTILAAPTVLTPSNQTDTVGSAVTTAVSATCSMTACKNFTLNNAPSWLSINATTGVISGTAPTSTVTVTNLTVTVKDSYGSPVTSSAFTWTVKAAPTITSPGPVATSVNAAISATVPYTCANGPCTFTLNNGPTGVTINSSGLATGNTGNTATYNTASLTIKDADGVTATSATFVWTVSGTLTLSGNSARTVARGTSPSYSLSYSCPTSSCTVAITGSPTGLVATASSTTLIGLDTDGTGSTSPSLTAAGGLQIRGTVPSALAIGSYTVTITINDNRTVAGTYTTTATWTVI